jgi:hypothetical protein
MSALVPNFWGAGPTTSSAGTLLMFVPRAPAVDNDEDKIGFTADVVMRLAVDHPSSDDVQNPVVIGDHPIDRDLAESA